MSPLLRAFGGDASSRANVLASVAPPSNDCMSQTRPATSIDEIINEMMSGTAAGDAAALEMMELEREMHN